MTDDEILTPIMQGDFSKFINAEILQKHNDPNLDIHKVINFFKNGKDIKGNELKILLNQDFKR
jgi:hypothetical protein